MVRRSDGEAPRKAEIGLPAKPRLED